MLKVSQALQLATASTLAVEDGQDSMKRLAYAPLTFLPLGGNASYIASILASAVGFLEGYSSEDLESDVRLDRHPSGEYVAHTELKLVPYAFQRHNTLTSSTSVSAQTVVDKVEIPRAAQRFSMSRVVAVQEQPTWSSLELAQLDQLRNSFEGGVAHPDWTANDILQATDSVEVARSVLQLSAQVGLTIPRKTLEELLHRMQERDGSFARAILRDFEYEMNSGVLREASLLTPHCSSAPLSAKKRKRSKLERVRSASTPR